MHPAYPCSHDIGFAQWLKYFATRLPTVASRFGLTESEVTAIQTMALDYLNLLIHRLHCATQAVLLRQNLASEFQQAGVPIGLSLPALVRDHMAQLVQRIYAHSCYSEADNALLKLSQFHTHRNTIGATLLQQGKRQATGHSE